MSEDLKGSPSSPATEAPAESLPSGLDAHAEPPPSSSGLTSTDEKLVAAAELGDTAALAAWLVVASGPGLESALRAATAGRHALAVMLLLERGALAAAIGSFSSALHRPGLSLERRIEVMELLLDHHRDSVAAAVAKAAQPVAAASLRPSSARAHGSSGSGSSGSQSGGSGSSSSSSGGTSPEELRVRLLTLTSGKQPSNGATTARDVARLERNYRLAVSKALLAGAAQREGPLLLGALVRGGHVRSAFEEPAATDASAAQQFYKAALQLNKKAVSISWSVGRSGTGADAIVCDQVRVPVRRHYSGYLLAQQQLQLCAAGLSSVPWSAATHRHYPRSFRDLARCLLLCWRREPLCKLPDEVCLCVLEQLAALTFWAAPAVDLSEGEEICMERGVPLSKQPNYKAI